MLKVEKYYLDIRYVKDCHCYALIFKGLLFPFFSSILLGNPKNIY